MQALCEVQGFPECHYCSLSHHSKYYFMMCLKLFIFFKSHQFHWDEIFLREKETQLLLIFLFYTLTCLLPLRQKARSGSTRHTHPLACYMTQSLTVKLSLSRRQQEGDHLTLSISSSSNLIHHIYMHAHYYIPTSFIYLNLRNSC